MGHTKIENNLMDALSRITLSGYQHRIVMALLRLTSGYHVKEASASYAYISSMTGIPRGHVHRAVKNLVDRNIITVTTNGNSPKGKSLFGFAPVDKWLLLPLQRATVTANGNATVTANGNTTLYTKITIKKTIKKTGDEIAQARLSLFNQTEQKYAKSLTILMSSGVDDTVIVEIVRSAIILYSVKNWKECFACIQRACSQKFPAVEISGSLRACNSKETPPNDYRGYFFACLYKHGQAIGDQEWTKIWPMVKNGQYDKIKTLSDVLDGRGV